jgi:hypothetical protein
LAAAEAVVVGVDPAAPVAVSAGGDAGAAFGFLAGGAFGVPGLAAFAVPLACAARFVGAAGVLGAVIGGRRGALPNPGTYGR